MIRRIRSVTITKRPAARFPVQRGVLVTVLLGILAGGTLGAVPVAVTRIAAHQQAVRTPTLGGSAVPLPHDDARCTVATARTPTQEQATLAQERAAFPGSAAQAAAAGHLPVAANAASAADCQLLAARGQVRIVSGSRGSATAHTTTLPLSMNLFAIFYSGANGTGVANYIYVSLVEAQQGLQTCGLFQYVGEQLHPAGDYYQGTHSVRSIWFNRSLRCDRAYLWTDWHEQESVVRVDSFGATYTNTPWCEQLTSAHECLTFDFAIGTQAEAAIIHL